LGDGIKPVPQIKMIAIYIPTINNKNLLASVVSNIKQTAEVDYNIYFIIEKEDVESLKEINRLQQDNSNLFYIVNTKDKGPNNCFNLAYKNTTEEYFVITIDDVIYPQGWLRQAMEQIGDKSVLAFNEKNCGGWGFFLVKREYIKNQSGVIDMPDLVYFPYRHQYADSEFQFTARHRGEIIYSDIELDHRDVSFFGEAYEEDGIQKVLVKNIIVRDLMIARSEVNVTKIENDNNPKEILLKIELIPRNPILTSKKERKKEINDSVKDDKAIFLSRAHLWGGKTIEDVIRADQYEKSIN